MIFKYITGNEGSPTRWIENGNLMSARHDHFPENDVFKTTLTPLFPIHDLYHCVLFML